MRFLYGDTEPFPPQYDFLAALEAFLAHAARAVKLDAEVRAVRHAADADQAERTASIEALAKFHEGRMRSLAQAMPVDAEAPTREYVRQLSDLANSIVESAKASNAQATALAAQETGAEVSRRRAEIRSAVASFLTVLRLPATSTKATMRLQDGHNELTATIESADGVAVAVALSTREKPAWQVPRKVSDFAKGIDLPVGVRRSWFSKGVQQEMAHIDDYVVGGFELSDDAAEIRLRKKPGEKDTIVFHVRRAEDGGALSAEVHHPEDPEADGMATALDADARGHLERLWDALRQSADELAGHRERVLQVTMNEADVVETDMIAPLVENVIGQIAPIVQEIARRSSNAVELSLKAESEKGRREEIYVAKADLLKHLEPLGPDERTLFAPLGLSSAPATRPPNAPPRSRAPSSPGAAAIAPIVPASAGVPAAAVAGAAAGVSTPGEKKGRESGPDDGAWDVEVSS